MRVRPRVKRSFKKIKTVRLCAERRVTAMHMNVSKTNYGAQTCAVCQLAPTNEIKTTTLPLSWIVSQNWTEANNEDKYKMTYLMTFNNS